ncbi:45200_t:CDS:2, partial [Gigaspora margarita]
TTTTGGSGVQKRNKWTELELNYLEHHLRSFSITFVNVKEAALLNKQLLEKGSLEDEDIDSFTAVALLYALLKKNNSLQPFSLIDKTIYESSLETLKIKKIH